MFKTPVLRISWLFIPFLLATLSNSVFAQNIFELTYQFKSDPTATVYKGLLINNADGTGFLRLSGTNSKTAKRILYDFSLSRNPYEYGKLPMEGGLSLTDPANNSYWYCWSENFMVKEGEEPFAFDYLQLWLKRDKGKVVVEPCLKTPFNVEGRSYGLNQEPTQSLYPVETDASGNKQQKYIPTGILSCKELKNTSFTKDYLKDYFISTELVSAAAYTKKQLLAARNNIKPVLHLLTVINTGDADIKVNCTRDGKKISGYMKKVAASLQIPLNEINLIGGEFNLNALKAALNTKVRPKVKKDDIIVFFYSGHGFDFKGEKESAYPRLALYYNPQPSWDHIGAKSLSMEDIYQQIVGMGARLNMVMSDCCNTIVNIRRSEIRDTLGTVKSLPNYDMNKRKTMALFLQTQASMLVSAAEKGQAAICTDIDDGFFTTSFLKTMGAELKNAGPDPQWVDIIRKTKGETSTMAVKYKSAQNIIFKLCATKNEGTCVEDVGTKMVK